MVYRSCSPLFVASKALLALRDRELEPPNETPIHLLELIG
jgi:hypothetical protein